MDVGINIGSPGLSDAAEQVAGAIVKILSAPVEQETLREALRTFASTVKVENVTIQDVNLDARTDARTINVDAQS